MLQKLDNMIFSVFLNAIFPLNTGSDCLQDVMSIKIPQRISWSPGSSWLIEVFDWDKIYVSDTVPAVLDFEIKLCVGIFPCSVDINGNRSGHIISTDMGKISCLDPNGCHKIVLDSISVDCTQFRVSDSFFQIQGSILSILNSSFSGCKSSTDGGIVRSYDHAKVSIRSSTFNSAYSSGFGGAIVAYGTHINISDSAFVNCTSDSGGGAIWASSFHSCYGSIESASTLVIVVSSSFHDCKSEGPGGAILCTSDMVSDASNFVDIQLISSEFRRCESGFDGGALLLSGKLTTGHVGATSFIECRSASSGGAVSAKQSATLSIDSSSFRANVAAHVGGAISGISFVRYIFRHSSFVGNTAGGLGGGALHLFDSSLLECNLTFFSNEASQGGGGAILWQGNTSITKAAFCTELAEFESELCENKNTAIYGCCLASDYKRLHILMKSESFFPGIPIELVVVKKDAYNQTISSDSDSVLVAQPVHTSLSIISGSLAQFEEGNAEFSLSLKPTFSDIDFRTNRASILFTPSVLISGEDTQTGNSMVSEILHLNTKAGKQICPPGYILEMDGSERTDVNISAMCIFCKEGTYSINPFAPLPGSPDNAPAACLSCPLGGDCKEGGNQIKFEVGYWLASDGFFVLRSCPAGYQLINSSAGNSKGAFSHNYQYCRKCLEGKYVINPNVDSCQTCSPGMLNFCM